MEVPDEDTIRILITTDNHVGYNENDPITGDDSWKTFHEIMMLSKAYNVDMVLQSGDLFHLNKPTKKSMYHVLKTLRLACMGDKPCELELLSDPAEVFTSNEFTNVNYEDPNYNISVPMFAIAGNHDDATGDSLLCPLDLLHVSGLVNHFGKVLETDKINLVPLLFQKGNTKLALYGLASIREERLFRTFKEGAVTFEVPTIRNGEWFNLMLVHQNHTGHTNTAFLPEQFLPDFLDMVIWGHEHECIPNMVYNPTKEFNVLQPGSSVATSLCDAEAKPKYAFIMEINYKNKQPKLTPIPLNTIRTFKMKNIALKDVPDLNPHDKEAISKYLVEQVEQMIEEANQETRQKLGIAENSDEENQELDESADPLACLSVPLIRLRVDYSASIANNINNIDYQVENPRRFSNRFVGRVANANNVIQFYKSKRQQSDGASKKSQLSHDNMELQKLIDNSSTGELGIETLVADLLHKMQLSLLPEVGLNEAVKKFVDKDEKGALKEFIEKELDAEVKMLACSDDFLNAQNPSDMKLLIKEVKRANSLRPSSSSTPIEQEDIDFQSRTSHSVKSKDVSKTFSHQIPTKAEQKHALHKNKTTTASKDDAEILSSNDANNDIIALSSEEDDDEEYKENATPTANTRHYLRHPAGDNPIGTKRKRSARSTKTTKTASSRPRGTQTPKTDILEGFLARKRK
ncbi:MRX complex nuclease subunit KNAG_0J02110 [Huiozyma naganishii CBS 8797]|uniref:Double-strand break repair protein n=1 Tax=Huiozyma naganishii (strain ATCC MYA-139 / BCRC 22969 / CBS 8797 / KCTC 17520 / NBRC 10181 / NCYC 3082 / Yp74L-3) TaxID=1071383 RepID=J7S2X4_HUIN7|nr:hypothetical protein KNAG_0J02110 [Kazachstania naganishii CBS 8797]CCK72292.1 hypothetical protein KNAG_0J02110 [Kazachstania naganishii CBS 8797]